MLNLLGLIACTPLAGDWPGREAFPQYTWQSAEVAEATQNPDGIDVLNWNVKFAGGRVDFWFDGHGDRVHMTEAEVQVHLDGLAALIRDFDPGVLMLQEVDIASKRTAYVDMVQELLDRTGLNYGAWVPVWDVAFIPEQGLGPMKMGQAVLSKWPISENLRIDQGPIETQDGLTRYFYLDRCIQRVHLDLGDSELVVLNNHPDAYSSDGTKGAQIELILEEALGVEALLVVGGDFNAVPDGSLQLEDFADDPDELEGRGIDIVHYKSEGDLVPDAFYEQFDAAIDLQAYQAATSVEEQSVFFTHSIEKSTFWTRKLDYLFTNGVWTEALTVQKPGDGTELDAMTLSDHAPLFARLEAD
ncbi:MAG: endonuclease/exonuclease/phosphatase family protein [Myxococcota bacterium]|nr:endonuclease/exonuclease/phosphatase family protein [Myxococcota bacterium]